jgi:hypothetical protein
LDELGSLLSAWLLCGPWWPLLLGRNNCGGLDDQFLIACGRRGLSVWLLCGPWWPLLLWGNICGGLDDQFVIAHGRRGRYG